MNINIPGLPWGNKAEPIEEKTREELLNIIRAYRKRPYGILWFIVLSCGVFALTIGLSQILPL